MERSCKKDRRQESLAVDSASPDAGSLRPGLLAAVMLTTLPDPEYVKHTLADVPNWPSSSFLEPNERSHYQFSHMNPHACPPTSGVLGAPLEAEKSF